MGEFTWPIWPCSTCTGGVHSRGTPKSRGLGCRAPARKRWTCATATGPCAWRRTNAAPSWPAGLGPRRSRVYPRAHSSQAAGGLRQRGRFQKRRRSHRRQLLSDIPPLASLRPSDLCRTAPCGPRRGLDGSRDQQQPTGSRSGRAGIGRASSSRTVARSWPIACEKRTAALIRFPLWLGWISQGHLTHFGSERFTWSAGRTWKSRKTGGAYPIETKITTTDPASGQPVTFTLEPLFPTGTERRSGRRFLLGRACRVLNDHEHARSAPPTSN